MRTNAPRLRSRTRAGKTQNFPYFSYFPRRGGCGGSRQKNGKKFLVLTRRFPIILTSPTAPNTSRASITGLKRSPALVSLYSTFGGTTGYALRSQPSSSSSLSDWISILSVTFSTSLIFSSTPATFNFVSYTSTQIIMPFHLPSMALRASWVDTLFTSVDFIFLHTFILVHHTHFRQYLRVDVKIYTNDVENY